MSDTEKLSSDEGTGAAIHPFPSRALYPTTHVDVCKIVELFLNTAQQIIQCREPIESADLFADAFGSQ
jgi:hypothetical protein